MLAHHEPDIYCCDRSVVPQVLRFRNAVQPQPRFDLSHGDVPHACGGYGSVSADPEPRIEVEFILKGKDWASRKRFWDDFGPPYDCSELGEVASPSPVPLSELDEFPDSVAPRWLR